MGDEINHFDNNCEIEGVNLTNLRRISDERGAVLHFLREDSLNFKRFGEAYFSLINHSIVKGWKKHNIIDQNFCVPHGKIKFVIYDNRKNSVTRGNVQEFILDNNENYFLLSLPSNLWYSFKGIGKEYSLLANIINFPHSKEEAENLPLDTKEIPYDWNK